MSTTVWEVIDTIRCDRTGEKAQLLEERVYAGDPVPDVGRPFHVRARKCSLGGECNLAGYACRWSYLNPNFDPFADRRASSA
jgi:hypothetical protein